MVRRGRPRVAFVPFAVDTGWFLPEPGREAEVDVVSIGADPHRDFPLLTGIATRRPELSFRIVATAERAAELRPAPTNVDVQVDVPFVEVRDRLAAARVVALPVRENSYSGATTVLLQALAMGKPVVVSLTKAIATGYGLVDGENCWLVAPGGAEAFEEAIGRALADGDALSSAARATAESLTWDRYADTMCGLLLDAAHDGGRA